MPLKEILCLECGHQWEDLLSHHEPLPHCPHCDTSKVEQLPNSFGGYKINGNNGASTRPKGAGSKPRRQ